MITAIVVALVALGIAMIVWSWLLAAAEDDRRAEIDEALWQCSIEYYRRRAAARTATIPRPDPVSCHGRPRHPLSTSRGGVMPGRSETTATPTSGPENSATTSPRQSVCLEALIDQERYDKRITRSRPPQQ